MSSGRSASTGPKTPGSAASSAIRSLSLLSSSAGKYTHPAPSPRSQASVARLAQNTGAATSNAVPSSRAIATCPRLRQTTRPARCISARVRSISPARHTSSSTTVASDRSRSSRGSKSISSQAKTIRAKASCFAGSAGPANSVGTPPSARTPSNGSTPTDCSTGATASASTRMRSNTVAVCPSTPALRIR